MSWLEKLLPPKITQTDPAERRSVPEGLWIKCPSCDKRDRWHGHRAALGR